jgi:hypothetical protein
MPDAEEPKSLKSPVKFCGTVSIYSLIELVPEWVISAFPWVKTGLARYSLGNPRMSDPVTMTSSLSLAWPSLLCSASGAATAGLPEPVASCAAAEVLPATAPATAIPTMNRKCIAPP